MAIDRTIINPLFDLYGLNGGINQNEQNLVKDLVSEAISIMGISVKYLPRTLQKEDKLFGEDVLSSFTTTYDIPMYIENIDGFEGENEFLKNFGLTVNDKATLIVSTPIFNQITSMTKPLEGDLIYFPLGDTLFEIKFVEDEKQFYPSGTLPQYKLEVELFQYSSEDILTGDPNIDDIINIMGETIITNLITYSRDFSNWSIGSGTPTLTKTEIGYDGNANSASTLTDDDITITESIKDTVTILDNNDIQLASIFIKKDSDVSRFPEFQFTLSGGVDQSIIIQINTSDGTTSIRSSTGTVNSGVIDSNDYWHLWVTVTNNTSGNINAILELIAAASSIFGTSEVSAIGSVVIDQAQIETGSIIPTIQVETSGSQASTTYVPGPTTINSDIEQEADSILDFTEVNPFGNY